VTIGQSLRFCFEQPRWALRFSPSAPSK
jgi:hypothetical protein